MGIVSMLTRLLDEIVRWFPSNLGFQEKWYKVMMKL